MVNDPSELTDLQVIKHFGNSDHNMITFNLQCPIPRVRKVFLYSQGNYENIDSKLELTDWDSLFNGMSLQQCWDKFKNVYNELIN